MTAFQYAVLQYMPDPARQECVNVGVVVAIPGSGSAEVRMLRRADAARLKWLGADDIEFLDDLAEDLSHPRVPEGGSAADALARAHTDWGGTIRVSAPRAILYEGEARDLCEELYARYVAPPVRP